MKAKLIIRNVRVQKSPIHGYGVFAQESFSPGEIIEECYLLVNAEGSWQYSDYYFEYKNFSGLSLGYGGIYNHAKEPNATYELDEEHALLVIKANQPIQRGEEIFISYGKNWFSQRRLVIKTSLRYKLKKLLRKNKLILRFIFVTSFIVSFAVLVHN